MLIASFFSWWYSGGLKKRFELLGSKLDLTRDYFSIGLLLKTLFSPFRMIDANTLSQGSLDMRFRSWIDKLISSLIGAMIRTTVMIVGILALGLQSLLGLVGIIVWILTPVIPAACLILFALGWAPAWPL